MFSAILYIHLLYVAQQNVHKNANLMEHAVVEILLESRFDWWHTCCYHNGHNAGSPGYNFSFTFIVSSYFLLAINIFVGFSLCHSGRATTNIWVVHWLATTHRLFYYGELQTVGRRHALLFNLISLYSLFIYESFYYRARGIVGSTVGITFGQISARRSSQGCPLDGVCSGNHIFYIWCRSVWLHA